MNVTLKYFYIEMEVVDQHYKNINQINASTVGARLVFRVKNTSLRRRGAGLHSSLQSQPARLEFIQNNLATATWSTKIPSIAPSVTLPAECPIRRNGGPASTHEPIQCDQIDDTRYGAWVPINTKQIPFSILVRAA